MTGVCQLDSGKRPMLMYGIHHKRHSWNIFVVPKSAFNIRSQIGAVMNFHLFGANNAPTAFRFYPPHFCERPRHAVSHAITVRRLVETIRRYDRPDFYGLTEDVKFVIHI